MVAPRAETIDAAQGPDVRSAAMGYLDGVLRVSDLVRRRAERQELVQAVADAIHAHLGWQVVLVNFVRPAHGDVLAAACAGSAEVTAAVVGRSSPLHDWQVLLSAGERRHGAYFVAAGRVRWEGQRVPSFRREDETSEVVDRWQPDDALLVPLRDSSGQLLGVISVDQPRSGLRPSMDDCAVLTAFCAHLEAALEIASLSASERQRGSALDSVGRLSELARVSSDSDEVVREVVRTAAECLGLEAAEAVLAGGDVLREVARWGAPGPSFAGRTLTELNATLAAGAAELKDGVVALDRENDASVVCALTDLRGRTLGAITATLPEQFGEDAAVRRRLLRMFADVAQAHLASSAHHALAVSEARKDAILVSSLDAILSVDEDSRIVEFNPAAERIFGYERSAVMHEDMAELIIPERFRGHHRAGLVRYLAGRGRGGIIGERIEVVARRADDSEFPAELAVVRVESDGPAAFTAFVRDISDRREARAELERERDGAHHAATHDALTGLPNLRGLEELHASADIAEPAVLSIAVAGLSAVAQALGQEIADELIRIAARGLARIAADDAVVARIEDRVFAVVGPWRPLERISAACVVALGQAVELGGISIQPEFSAGLASPDDVDLTELLRRAAVARAPARPHAGSTTCPGVFAPALDTSRARISLASELRRAIEADQLVLHYQPLWGPRDRRLRGLEALVRWQRRDGTLVPPLDFISLAESTGLIAPLGEWVVAEACRQAAAWRTLGLAPPIIGINVSPHQLPHHDIVAVFERELHRVGLAPGAVCVEVTETALDVGAEQMIDTLRRLSAAGVCCALDDFGAEYSSLTRLSTLPFDTVKLDRAFLRDVPGDPRPTAFLKAVVALGRSLDLSVTVEGVEDEQQLALLQRLDVASVQGFLFGRPQPAERTASLLGDRSTASRAELAA